jgi:glycosyltransferase involved in cell wall biosynthesis
LAAHLEEAFDCRVLAPHYLAEQFRRPIVCPDPIYFKRGLVGRRPFWRQRAGVKLGPDSFIYAPHMHGHLAIRSQVITIHDLIWQQYPTRNIIENAFNSYILPSIVSRSAGVITVSQTSRAAIARYFRIDDRKIAVVGNGLDLDRWKRVGPPHAARRPEYLLVVSANRPYKNTIELIENRNLWSTRFRLKIVSSKARYGLAIRRAVSASNLHHLVEFIDDIPESALIDLYRNCTAAVHPSLIEGFSRPAIEAMAVGRPVILSDIPVHREIFGGAAIFVTTGDRGSWEAAFRTLDDDDEVARLTAAGLVVAEKFGWDRVGRDLEHALLQFEPRLGDLHRGL